jgi:PGF-CTERM protein
MRVPLTLVVASLAFVAAAGNVAAASVTWSLEMHNTADLSGTPPYWFVVAGSTAQNPTLNANASDAITANLANKGTVQHNFEVHTSSGSVVSGSSTGTLDANGTKTVTFTIPSDAAGTDLTYICTIHGSAMSGKIHVAGTASSPKSGTPGFEAAFALVAVAGVAVVLARRK